MGERTYETMFEAVDDGVFLFDVDWDDGESTFRFERNNPAHESMTGISTATSRGQTPKEVFGAETGREMAKHLETCVQTAETVEYDAIQTYPAGTVEIQTELRPIVEDGAVTRIVGLSRETTTDRELELAARTDRLRVLFEQAPDGIVVHDVEGNVLDVNETLAEMLGYTREKLCSMTVPEFEVGIDSEELRERWQAMETGGLEKIAVEGTHRRKNGSTYPVEVWVSKIHEDADSTDRFLALVRDVTDRKVRERELEYYETLVENAGDVLWLFDRDISENLVINSAYKEILGQPTDRLDDDATAFLDVVHPEDRDRLENAIDRLSGGDAIDLEVRVNPSEQFQRWLWIRGKPVDVDGEFQTVVGFARDITDRKAYEQKLEAERDFLDTIIESLPFPFYILDTEDYTVERSNSRAVVQEGQTCYEMTHDRERPCDEGEEQLPCPIDQLQESEQPVTVEHTHTVDNEERVFQVHAAPIFDNGELTRVAESNIDVTDRVEYQRRLEEQRDNLQVLNQVVRHDIRNDLQLVSSYAELLDGHVDESGQDHLSKIKESARNAVDLTKSARELAEVMLQSEADRREVALARTLDEQIEDIRSVYSTAVITIDGTLPRVDVVGNDMLGSVFQNLLQNAVQHNDKDIPRITVSAEAGDERATVRIADNGPGIPDGQKDEVFGKDERGLDSDGTGLGLYLVKSLVDSYGGGVWVEDRAGAGRGEDGNNKGSTDDGAVFVVELPLAA